MVKAGRQLQTFEDQKGRAEWMTAHELEMLQKLIEERFDDRDRKTEELRLDIDAMKNSIQRIEVTQAEHGKQIGGVMEVVDDLRDIRNGFVQVTRFVQVARSKRTWAILAGVIVVGNWVAEHVPQVVGWFS